MTGPLLSKIMDDYESRGWLDSEAFHHHTVAVHNAITERTSIADIKRAMGEKCNARMLYDSIAALVGTGDIRREWGAFDRWSRQTPPKQARCDRMSIAPAKPADRTKPLRESIVPSRSVTA